MKNPIYCDRLQSPLASFSTLDDLNVTAGHNFGHLRSRASPGTISLDLVTNGFFNGLLEWGMLSSAMGTFLGFLLLWAGLGWLKAGAWAVPVTIAYVLCGLAVNFTDMIIFIFQAKAGPMRTQMIIFDGIAFLIPLTLGILLVVERNKQRASRRVISEEEGKGNDR